MFCRRQLPLLAITVFRPALSFAPIGNTLCLSSNLSHPATATNSKYKRLMSAPSSSSTEVDPYLWLEEVESERALDFAKASNEACLAALGDPTTSSTGTYDRILKVLESNDRIPSVSQFGHDEETGEPVLFNFWKDSQNPKGLWRKTTLESYQTESPQWETVLDVDQQAEKDGISWVWKGSTLLSRARDEGKPKMPNRALLSLSRGGSDAVHIKEFDLKTGDFVEDRPFTLPEAKTRVSYRSRNVIMVGTDMGPESLTDSGYPRTVREWERGTDIQDAPIIFEGEKKDVSVGMYISDQRTWGGSIYEVQYRSLTFYTSIYWARKIEPEHLLSSSDPRRTAIAPPADFIKLDIQEDASISFVGKLALISLRSDWQPDSAGKTFKRGSVIYTNADEFMTTGSAECTYSVLFEPTERTAYEYFTCTKNYLILSTMDNVKAKLSFFKIEEGGTKFTAIERASAEQQIRDCSARPVDAYSGSDEFWFSSSDFVTPTTLYLADAAKVESKSSDVDFFITKKLKSLPPQYDSSGLKMEQRVATSKDGTQIPYFIVMKEDMVLDGNAPTLLYGYGGFEVSLGPHYIATAGLAWIERGGVYVEANIRGGGEFGKCQRWICLAAFTF